MVEAPRMVFHCPIGHNGFCTIQDATAAPNPNSPMPSPAPNPPRGPTWLLRRADQLSVAVLVLVALAATVGWWVSQGGWQGRLIEIERSRPQTATFQVDVNTADWPELAQLPGIGETLARRIIESRDTEGPFMDHNDVQRVRGIGPKTLDRLRPYLLPLPDAGALAGR